MAPESAFPLEAGEPLKISKEDSQFVATIKKKFRVTYPNCL